MSAVAPPAGRTALDVVRAHMEAEHRHDVEAAVACFTERAYYRIPGLDVELHGRDEIRRWYEDLFTAFPDFSSPDERYWEVRSDGEHSVFYESRMEGTHLGPLRGWAPTGRRISTPMLVRIPIAADGLMEAEIVYFDTAHLFADLGVLPRAGSPAELALQRLHGVRQGLRRLLRGGGT